MKKSYDMPNHEMAMRAMIHVQQMARGEGWLIEDIARCLVTRYGCARTTAHRMVRSAVDILGISYDKTKLRCERLADIRREAATRSMRKAA